MFVKEIWRYPVKSMAGERLHHARIGTDGIEHDRKVLVVSPSGHIVTSRTSPELLGLRGTIGEDGQPHISGHLWNSPEALQLVRKAVGFRAELIYHEGPERFDVLPLLVATDGAMEALARDGRRLRPNLVIGAVDGLAERSWPGNCLRIRQVLVGVQDLRARCVMTTFDPDTLEQDHAVLKEIVKKFGGKLALNCFVIADGEVRVDDEVNLMPGKKCAELHAVPS